MAHASWRMAHVIFLTMLVFAIADNDICTTRQSGWDHTFTSPATGKGAAPVSITIAPQDFSEPSWTMPNLRGWRLNAAKRELLRLTDYNVASLKSHDASGAGRTQFWDSNWKVCEQNVPTRRQDYHYYDN
jgi:hypothetical protein